MINKVCIVMTGLALWTIGVFAQQVTLPATLDVPSGNRLFLHVYAKGVQIYRCTQDKNDTSVYVWTFVAPAADLFTAPDYTTATGKHYAGPTWEATDGSKVTGKKLQQANGPDTAAIPWLLLSVGTAPASGTFSGTTFIQRINTQGGKAPAAPARGSHPGEELKVPYTAEYLFYRAAM
jgi:hypothetical protein